MIRRNSVERRVENTELQVAIIELIDSKEYSILEVLQLLNDISARYIRFHLKYGKKVVE